MAKIQEFISEVKTHGLARTNRFLVDFTPPNADQTLTKKVVLFCSEAQLPSMSYATVQNRSFGEFREMPYDRLFENVTLTFHVDRDFVVKSIFDDWMQIIQYPSSRTFNYYRNYTTQMKIQVQDLADKTKYEVQLFECYPKTINAINLSSESKDTMKLSVTFQYKYWTSSNIEEMANGHKLTKATLTNYNENFTGFQSRLRKGLGEAGNFLTGAVGQYAMRSFSSYTSRLPAIRF